MSDVREEPIRWRRHRGWFYYSKLLASVAALAIAANWFINRL